MSNKNATQASGFAMPHSAAMTYPVDVASEPGLIIEDVNAPFSVLVYVQLFLLFVCFLLCCVPHIILFENQTTCCAQRDEQLDANSAAVQQKMVACRARQGETQPNVHSPIHVMMPHHQHT